MADANRTNRDLEIQFAVNNMSVADQMRIRHEQNRRDRETMVGGPTIMSGESRINGDGDVKVSVSFATKFSEKPLFFFGGEILDTYSLVPGAYPSISAFVYDWITEERLPTSRFYTGAILAVSITSGDPNGKYVLHWHFSGKAFVSPSVGGA